MYRFVMLPLRRTALLVLLFAIAAVTGASRASAQGPGPPTGVTATAGNAQVSLTWNAVYYATGYHVKRSTTSGGPYTTVGSPTGTSYTDTGLTNGTTYYYVVSALGGWGETANSSQVSATPSGGPPAPTGLTATAGDTQVVLSWNTVTGASTYNLKRSTTNGGPYCTIASPTTNGYTDTGLTDGTTYYYVVSAVVSGVESANSTQVSATPTSTTPPSPGSLTLASVGNTSVGLSWTASPTATGYKVKRAPASLGPFATVGTTAGTSYSDANLTPDTTYYYVVTATNVSGEGPSSNEVVATTSYSPVGGVCGTAPPNEDPPYPYVAYQYGQLSPATGLTVSSVNYGDGETQGYGFDPMGNRLSKTDNVTGNESYTFNNANMLLSRNNNTYSNDLDGNTLTGGGRTCGWDSQNRLVSCVDGSNTSTYVYGADGYRHQSTVNGVTTDFVLDGQFVTRERRSGINYATYFIGANGPLYRRDDTSGSVRWYLFDGLGSVLGEVDPSGNVTDFNKYDVYGPLRDRTGTATTAHGFVGQLGHTSEAETGLIYMRARYTDPVVGRFLSQNPGGGWWKLVRVRTLFPGDTPGFYWKRVRSRDDLDGSVLLVRQGESLPWLVVFAHSRAGRRRNTAL